MGSEGSDEKCAASVPPKAAFCTCPGFKLAPARKCRHMRLIKPLAAAAPSTCGQAVALRTGPEP